MNHKVGFRQTMRAEMRPDCYGGETCDQIQPRWNAYAHGDKQDDYTREPLTLDAKHFPPGTMVIVQEPTCPECDELREPPFDKPCRCGFDWNAWTLSQYS
jgi:hypothetical protein